MDDQADERPEPRAQVGQELVDGCTIVRRTEIIVEREITTVVLRRKNECAGPTPEAQPPANKDSEDCH